jgi:thiaminase (transcriptional activator TenA)
MKLSTQAWNKSSHIYDAIINHPFNKELMQGSLDRDKFFYYIEQDTVYLQDFARCYAVIASKSPSHYIRKFLRHADNIFIAEQEIVHQFFMSSSLFKKTDMLTPSTIGYTSYLLRICSMGSIEEAIAAILPCCWVYREVGLFIVKHAKEDNPYIRWIENYSSEEFSLSVDEMISIFDKFAENASPELQNKMLDIFYKSASWEWHFWNDSYLMRSFDRFN